MIYEEKTGIQAQSDPESYFSTRICYWFSRVLARFLVGAGKRVQHNSLISEKGFIDIYLLTIYMLCILTMLGVGSGICASVWRVASAEFMWFGEAMDFAASAANTNGDIQGVTENQSMAQQYFNMEFGKMMPTGSSYSLNSFQVVNTGAWVPHGTAIAPGYLAQITVQIPVITVPLIGQQNISVPMNYFAVAKSQQI